MPGRRRKSDWLYIDLLEAWEADEAARPGLHVKVRMADFLRKDIPARLGLKVGNCRQRNGGNSHGALFDALARGRWARDRLPLMLAERRRRTSLLSESANPPVSSNSSVARGILGFGLVTLEPTAPIRLRGR